MLHKPSFCNASTVIRYHQRCYVPKWTILENIPWEQAVPIRETRVNKEKGHSPVKMSSSDVSSVEEKRKQSKQHTQWPNLSR